MTYFSGDLSTQDIAYIQTAMHQALLSREQEYTLASEWIKHGNTRALDELILAYSKLVVSVALRFKHYGIPFSDLLQEGNVALLYAAKRFDPDRDVRFSSYAKWWILAFIQEYILRNWSIVRTGTTTAQKTLFFQLNRLKAKLSILTETFLQTEERLQVAEHLQVSMGDVEAMEKRLLNVDFSIHAFSFGANSDLEATLKDDRPNPEEHSLLSHQTLDQKHWIDFGLTCLNPREVYIILKHRLTEPPETLEKIGKDLGITKERVRQLEARSLRKMKQHYLKYIAEIRCVIN